MIEEALLNRELSDKLLELGYEGNIGWEDDDDKLRISQACAMRWLREKGIYIEIGIFGKTNIKFGFNIVKSNEGEIYPPIDENQVFYNEYEEACEEGIKYCLENLI